MKQSLYWLVVGSLAGWLFLSALSFARAGTPGLILSAVACLLCFVPTLVSLLLANWSTKRSGADQLMAVFGGMGIRMLVVLGLGLAIFLSVAWFREEKGREYVFWGNVLISYLFFLGLETFLVLRQKKNNASESSAEVRN